MRNFAYLLVSAVTAVGFGSAALAVDVVPSSAPDQPKPAEIPIPAAHASVPAPPRVPRKTIPIAGQWNLTAEKHDRTEMDGPRTKLLVATGHPTLKHGPDMFRGPWDIDAHADRIDADFVQKKFILHGSPVVVSKDPKTHATLKSLIGATDTVIEIGFTDLKIAVTAGDVKTETPAPAKADSK
jgi:hypothetical protein